jgi:hypothetical protein
VASEGFDPAPAQAAKTMHATQYRGNRASKFREIFCRQFFMETKDTRLPRMNQSHFQQAMNFNDYSLVA